MMGKRERRRWPRRAAAALVVALVAGLAFIGVAAPLNPVRSAVRTAGFALSGRLHFPEGRIGQEVADERGKRYSIFREVVVDPAPGQPATPGAILTIEFRVTSLSPAMNRLYSALPLPLYIGDPGFRSKLFTIDGADCRSIYEWDSVRDAEAYVGSIALRTILARAAPGSVSYRIEPR